MGKGGLGSDRQNTAEKAQISFLLPARLLIKITCFFFPFVPLQYPCYLSIVKDVSILRFSLLVSKYSPSFSVFTHTAPFFPLKEPHAALREAQASGICRPTWGVCKKQGAGAVCRGQWSLDTGWCSSMGIVSAGMCGQRIPL